MDYCKLCRNLRALRSSHVLPEFLFRHVYGSEGSAHHLNGATGKKRIVQIGPRERLLCDVCEGVFQCWEHYFAGLWYQRDPLPDPIVHLILKRHGIDFERFFRFHLSILWRASVASGPMFSAVSLGPFEEPLREFLHGDLAVLPHEPSIYGMVLRRPATNELWGRIVLAPVRSRIQGVTVYTFVFGGCSWHYCVSKHRSPFPDSLRLKRPGNMIMPVIDYTQEGSISRAWYAWKRSVGGHF